MITSSFSNNWTKNVNFPIRSCLRKLKNYILFGTDEGKLILFNPINQTIYKSVYLNFPISTCFLIKNDIIYLQGIDGTFYIIDSELNILKSKELEILPNPIEIIPIVLKDRIFTATNNYLWILDKNLDVLNQVRLKNKPIALSYFQNGILVITNDGIYKYDFNGALMGFINEKTAFALSSDTNIIFNSFIFNYSKGFNEVYPIIRDSIFAYSDIKNNIYFWSLTSNNPLFYSFLNYNEISDFPTVKRINILVYPNPINRNQKFTIRFYADEIKNYKIRIFDFSGRIVLERELEVKLKGINEITIDNNLKSGAYIVDIEGQKTKFYVK